MDHIPFPNDPVFPRPEVRFVCGEGFEEILQSVAFEKYPEVRGIDLDIVSYENYDEDSLDQFLQEWAYFELLRECLETRKVSLSISKCTRKNEHGEKILDTSSFPDLFKIWADKLPTEKSKMISWPADAPMLDVMEQVKAENQRIEDLLKLVSPVVDRCRRSRKISVKSNTSMDWPEALHLSISLLLEGLFSMRFEFNWPAYEGAGLAPGEFVQMMSATIHDITPLVQRLHCSAWCPYETDMFYFGWTSLLLYIAATKPLDKHDTERCNKNFCSRFEIDELSYKPSHTSDCQGCGEPQGPDMDELSNLLENNRIPLVKVEETHGEARITVHDSENCEDYVAISHVWAHGLGNPTNNSLPICQLRRISTACSNIRSSSGRLYSASEPDGCTLAFWMDTLCIPVHGNLLSQSERGAHPISTNEERLRRLRKNAILQMASIYKYASKTLVLDKRAIPLGSDPNYYEQLVHLSTSGWLSRVWTLQEAQLGRNGIIAEAQGLLIPFRKIVLDIDPPDPDFSISSMFVNGVTMPICEVGPALKHRSSRGQLLFVIQQLRSRSTTKPADEAVCLTNILRLDVAKVFDSEDHEQRMQVFYSLLGKRLCMELLLLCEERLRVPGFRWAPKTLIAPKAAESSTMFAIHHIIAYENFPELMPRVRLVASGLEVDDVASWEITSPISDGLVRGHRKEVVLYNDEAEIRHSKGFSRISLVIPQKIEITQVFSSRDSSFSIIWHPSPMRPSAKAGVLVEAKRGIADTSSKMCSYVCPVMEDEEYVPRREPMSEVMAHEREIMTALVRENSSWCVD